MSEAALEYVLTDHAKVSLTSRNIAVKWLDQAIRYPVDIQPDKDDPELEHRIAVIIENEKRVLRVIISTSYPHRVITAYFDRKLRGKYETPH